MSQFIHIDASEFNGDFHPDCAIAQAHDAGLTIPGTGEAVQRITTYLGTTPLPGSTVVTITTAPDWTISSRTCDACDGSLSGAPLTPTFDETIPDFTLDEEPSGGVLSFAPGEVTMDTETGTFERHDPTHVEYEGTRYTLAEAVAFAQRRGLTKPEDWTWEQAAEYARQQYGYEGLTLIYADEDADTLAVDAQIAAEEEDPLVRAVRALDTVAKALQDLITR